MKRLHALCCSMLLVAAGATGARAASPVAVSDAWSPPGSASANVYATITNDGDDADRLIGASSPSATSFELHDALHGSATVPALVIPAHGTVTLAPGGRYLAFTGLKSATQDGDEFFARMHFERAGWVVAIVRVRTAQ